MIIPWAAVLLWMGLIFYLSSQPAVQSDSLSIGILHTIMGVLGRFIPGLAYDTGLLNHILRKATHFSAYLVLGILVLNAIWKMKALWKMKACRFRPSVLALGICVLYAASDEFHQLFVPGRGAQVTDVLIDSAGSLVGLIVFSLLFHRHGNYGNRNLKKGK